MKDASGSLKGPALVFGVSGEQGQHVVHGLVRAGYAPVYGATSDLSHVAPSTFHDEEPVQLIRVDLNDSAAVKAALVDTKATSIFLVTTTDLPPDDSAASASFKEWGELEYESTKAFFDILVEVYKEDGRARHIILSTQDDVESLNKVWSKQDGLEDDKLVFQPLDDGSVVQHYTSKGRAGKYAKKLLETVDNLAITLMTLPFLHSNFLASTIPLPNDKARTTQWTISACFGDAAIDMCSVSDLAYLVPSILANRELYDGYNLRVSAERITIEEVASAFADLFGKDVIYNPLTVSEMAELSIPGAPIWAQMCHYISDPRSSHDIDATRSAMEPRKPQLFKDWLLTNSDNVAFEKVGLALDAEDILTVTVFGATSPQGTSVVKGLLADTRKQYQIRATSRDISKDACDALLALDPDRVTLIQCNYDDMSSCLMAVDGADGAFLVTDFYDIIGGPLIDSEIEERHARNVIDACEKTQSVKHLVFSTLESMTDMKLELRGDLAAPNFDAKARAATYAKTKKLSITFVIMPIYSESFFELMRPEIHVDENTGKEELFMTVPKDKKKNSGKETKVMCMSVQELGPAVANIFDSYQVYAGHEIALVTDFVTLSEAAEMIQDVFFTETVKEDGDEINIQNDRKVETKVEDIDTWVEKRDTHIKDLGQLFQYYSKFDVVKQRDSIAQTLELVPDARPLRQWLEENRDNMEFRQMLGLR
mmetsp:Transcript_2544/g.4627  ORF Transcript_2544/g.4627 Transcript_2544/m.4627 type:complete len:710 (-) Transcript_2544:707-2836(-)|eukprot:CAMPEP_0198304144 /NCGR_PEP_ID=MMETSP1449-20131203/57250_1 /TAXON_ID=420275 /ORGANISM="Attheya septentrionalis, Strain CCMP2084" /LENGTH=709 /DNA_ID=CAMNT_0044006659 /DNA_START=103 /DNA_END=2232 /DNA_ORIENTATION=+